MNHVGRRKREETEVAIFKWAQHLDFESTVACPASTEITPLPRSHWSLASTLHEGSLHAASAIYASPPYFPTRRRTGRIIYFAPILALLPILTLSTRLPSPSPRIVQDEFPSCQIRSCAVSRQPLNTPLSGRHPFSASSASESTPPMK